MKTKFVRKGKTIKNIEAREVETFKSINKAKRRSLELQRVNGGIGRGSLVAIK